MFPKHQPAQLLILELYGTFCFDELFCQVFNGLFELFYLPVAISTAHATLGQIFFCLTASLAFFTGAGWRWDEAKQEDAGSPPLRHLAAATTGAVLVQLVLGAVYRHKGFGIAPHIVGACVVTALAAWLVASVLTRSAAPRAVFRPALLLGSLVIVQVFLGVESYILKIHARSAPHPQAPVVDLTTAHVAVGALVLVTSLYLTYQTYRFLSPRKVERQMVSAPERATT